MELKQVVKEKTGLQIKKNCFIVILVFKSLEKIVYAEIGGFVKSATCLFRFQFRDELVFCRQLGAGA